MRLWRIGPLCARRSLLLLVGTRRRRGDRPRCAVASRRRSVEATSTHGRKGELSRCRTLTLCLIVCVLLALAAGSVAHPATPQAKKDAQILQFFRTHPRLARTPAGQREILAALLRRVHRLEQTVRTLQSAKAARTPPEWWLEQAACIRAHEGAWTSNTGNGFYGAYQFMLSTWQSVGGEGYPHEASEEEQNYRAWRLWSVSGWAPWPNTSRMCGLR